MRPNMNEKTPIKERRKYNRTFKREVVAHWLASGKAAEAVSQELGISAARLYAWKRHFSPPTQPQAEDLRAQLEAARQELARVTEQRDILKKTLGILSEPFPKGMPASKP
jgi:transposase